MPCEWLKGPNGEHIHINYGRGNRGKLMKCKFCKFCNYNYRQNEGKLCDFPVAEGKTCDAAMCGSCARSLGAQRTRLGTTDFTRADSIDVCPIHRDQAVVTGSEIKAKSSNP